jgi:hypothetical protein
MTGSQWKNRNEAVVAIFKVLSHICPEELENYEYHNYNAGLRDKYWSEKFSNTKQDF